ncbi:MAG: hypothetical protein ABI651_09460 [Verrucomicrobiota bacterium]
MNKISPTTPANPRQGPPIEPRRAYLRATPIILGLGILGLLIAYQFHKQANQRAQSVDSSITKEQGKPAKRERSAPAEANQNATEPGEVLPGQPISESALASALPPPARAEFAAAAPVNIPVSAAYAQQLITQISQVDVSRGVLTKEQADQLKQTFKQLTEQGAAGVPAIRQFLENNQDLSFGEASAKSVGYSSLRAGLLDALRQIGGPEAVAVSQQVLQTTADPTEIALLARNLEEAAPGQHRQEVLSAAREALAQLSEAKQNSPEVAPLFQVLQTYGDSSVLADLENSLSKWGYYSTMVLAGMPSGEGIPTLIRIAQERGVSVSLRNEFALQMLAQVSAQYPDASAVLVEQARLNQIPETAWTKIATGLAGDQYQFSKNLSDNSLPLDNVSNLKTYHVQAGNQNFYSTPVTVNGSEEQINQRRALIDQLLAVNSNPAAVQALQNARAALAGKKP